LYVATTQQLTTPPSPSSSSLAVLVYNVLGRPATTVPGVVLGVLYNSSFKEVAFMNSSGYLSFYNIAPGTYILEVYHYPNTGLNFTEYWGGMTVNLQSGSNFVTFIRHEPFYNLQASASNGEIVVTVTVNGTVTSRTQGEIELWVANNPFPRWSLQPLQGVQRHHKPRHQHVQLHLPSQPRRHLLRLSRSAHLHQRLPSD